MKNERTPINDYFFDSMDKDIEKEQPCPYGPSKDAIFLHKNWGSITELPDLRMYDQNKYGKIDDEEYFELAVNNGMLKGCTPEEILILAINGNSLKYLKIAIQLGADVNTSNFQYTNSYRINSLDLIPIIFACQIGNVNIVQYLVDCGADIFLKKISISALKIASAYGNLEVVKYLVESGFDVNERKNEYGLFPIEYTISNYQFEVAKYLLEQGAINVELNNRRLIQLPFFEGWLRFVKLFMKYGATINGKDFWGNTALHYALYRDDFDKFKFLLDNGADIYLRNNDGENSLDIAIVENDQEIIDYLNLVNRGIKLKQIMESIKHKNSVKLESFFS